MTTSKALRVTNTPLALTNPLTVGKGGGKVTKEMLYDYADRLNRELWVQMSGKSYSVGVRLNAKGEEVHFLDRAGAA